MVASNFQGSDHDENCPACTKSREDIEELINKFQEVLNEERRPACYDLVASIAVTIGVIDMLHASIQKSGPAAVAASELILHNTAQLRLACDKVQDHIIADIQGFNHSTQESKDKADETFNRN